jgi:hypothetical protein
MSYYDTTKPPPPFGEGKLDKIIRQQLDRQRLDALDRNEDADWVIALVLLRTLPILKDIAGSLERINHVATSPLDFHG